METALFISRVIGPLFIIISIGLLFHAHEYRAMIRDISKNMMTLYIGGFLAALMGLLILESQNTFLVITILGYIAVIKGILILIFPQWTIQTFQKINFSENIIRIAGILCFALGSYVSFLGFM